MGCNSDVKFGETPHPRPLPRGAREFVRWSWDVRDLSSIARHEPKRPLAPLGRGLR